MTNTYRSGLLPYLLVGGSILSSAPLLAAPMAFNQIPPGAGAREPAPNVIVAVDDSGSMGTTGMATLKDALRQTFSANNVADGRIRLAWHSMNTCRLISLNGTVPAGCAAYNGIRPLEGAHRTNFMNWVDNFLPNRPPNFNLTPSHQTMQRSGEYLRTTGNWSPFRSVPGTADTTELSCRKSFNIFMTDGAWNTFQQQPYPDGSGIVVNGNAPAAIARGNADGTTQTLPDGTLYDTSAANTQTRMYRDVWGMNQVSTLADLAFHYWATDLQPSLTNNVRFTQNVTNNEVFGTTPIQPYWNPRNNPATWQNMVTYSIGFTTQATTWTGNPTWSGDMFGGPGFSSLADGTATWVSPLCNGARGAGNQPCDVNRQWNAAAGRRASELWHMALNSRGRFVPAPNAQSLVTAFQSILQDILSQTARPLVAISSNTSRLSRGGFAYVASFNSDRWSGDVAAYRMSDKTGLPSTTPTWKASTLLDASEFSPATRVVLTHDGSNGKGFNWNSLSAAQRSLLRNGTADTEAVGQARLNYLRGDRSLEQPATGGYLRQRDSRLGNIVNSNLWYVGKPLRMDSEYAGHAAFRSTRAGRTPVLYVGANDGMLHGFNAETGKEVLAYVPRGAYANLRNYTQPNYVHRYSVDGHPFAGDAHLGSGWGTVLVGTMGAGGRGYFVLDVTNPASFVDPGIGNSSVVLLDQTLPTNGDIGHIFAAPAVDNQTSSLSRQIVKLNNDRWAVIMGNGYNSTNERPVLLIQYLDGSRDLLTIPATSGGNGNGLGGPATFDVNGDGKVDIVYAGDLKGNLWKFNLASTDPTKWGVSNWSGSSVCSGTSCEPLLIAKSSGGTELPITAAPMLLPHPQGGVQVIFGTGKDLVANDRGGSQPTQSIFSVWDLSTYSIDEGVLVANETGNITESNARTVLVEQTVTATSSNLQQTSKNPITYSRTDSSAKRGWYFDLPNSGERILISPRLFDGQNLLINSVVPSNAVIGETCDINSAKDRSFISFLNAISGAPPKTSVFGDAMDPSGNASRIEYGSGEFITLVDSKNRKTTAINTDYFCTGDNCTDEGIRNNTAVCEGAACTACTGANCPPTVCEGEGCSCDGNTCSCVSEPCNCVGPNCVMRCGVTGSVLSACKSGFFGARTDWRELR